MQLPPFLESSTRKLAMAAAVLVCACVSPPSAADAADGSEVAGADGGDAAIDDPGGPPQKPKAIVGGSCDNGSGFIDWHGVEERPAIIRGIQGGQHIWASVRTQGLWAKKIRLSVEMFDAETGDVMKPGKVEITTSLKLNDGQGWLLYAGIPAFVQKPCNVMDRKLKVRFEANDLYGVQAVSEAFIRPTWDGFCPGAQPPDVIGSGPADAGPCDALGAHLAEDAGGEVAATPDALLPADSSGTSAD